MQISQNLNSTCIALKGANDAADPIQQQWKVTVSGTGFVLGDKVTLTFTDDSTATQIQFGAGDLTGVTPNFCYAGQEQMYVLEGTKVHQSAILDATLWNDPLDTGTGYVDMSTRMPIADNLLAMADYQGMLAFLSRWNIIIYQTSSDVNNWKFFQRMKNIGTLAGQSVQSLGQFDVIFAGDTGIRSLRVRDSSLMGFVDDVGSPIDNLVGPLASWMAANSIGNIYSVVDPQTGQYWMLAGSGIYVLSRYLSSQVTAWSLFNLNYRAAGVLTTVVPDAKPVVWLGQIYIRGLDTNSASVILQYGGYNNYQYDITVPQIILPWLDAGSPGSMKSFKSLQAALSGSWSIWANGNPQSEASYVRILSATNFTYDLGILPVGIQGTHLRIKLVGGDANGAGSATSAIFSAVLLHFDVLKDL